MDRAKKPRLRIDPQGTLRCLEPRRKNTARECDTAIARPQRGVLVVRCRNCDADHRFVVTDGDFTYNGQAPMPFAPDPRSATR
jgi:hypothetical protein